MQDRIVTFEQNTQACATDATIKSGVRNRSSVQPQARREPHKSSELDLRFKQNESLPIHSLPTELFLQVIHSHMRPYFRDSGMDYYQRLISLTGVCSRWCNIIRDSSSLWNQIHWSDSPEVDEIALRRSSNHPLDIVLHTDHAERELGFMSWFMTALDPHRHRWQSMDILVPSSWMGDVITALEEPALSLQSLSLTDKYNKSSTREFEFFTGSAPRLTNLTLNGVSIRWDSEVVYDLTVLDLSWISFPSTTTILNLLSHSPRLRTVTLHRCTTKSMANPSSLAIQLTHLTSLQLDLGSLDATEDLLRHMEAAGVCSLTASLGACKEIEGFVQRVLLKWMSKWKNLALVPLGGLLLEINGLKLGLKLSTTDRSEPLALAIEVSNTSWAYQLRVTLPQLIDAFQSWNKTITTLRLRLGYLPSARRDLDLNQFIVEQASRLPPVTSLELWNFQIDSPLHGLGLGDVSSLFQTIRTVSFLSVNDYELRNYVDWMCEMVQIVKDAAKSSSNESNRREHVLQLEFHVSESVASTSAALVEVAVKDLEGLAGSGNVLLFVEDD